MNRLDPHTADEVARILDSAGDGLRLLDRLSETWARGERGLEDIAAWRGELERWRDEVLRVVGRYTRGEITAAELPFAFDESEAWTAGVSALEEVRHVAAHQRIT
jgi:hypothetical protein